MIAYTEYGESLKKEALATLRVAAGRGFQVNAKAFPDPNAESTHMSEIKAERSARWEVILLLGSNETVRAADSYTALIFNLGNIAEKSPPDEHLWTITVNEIGVARSNFYNAARRDLGIDLDPLLVNPMVSWKIVSRESES